MHRIQYKNPCAIFNDVAMENVTMKHGLCGFLCFASKKSMVNESTSEDNTNTIRSVRYQEVNGCGCPVLVLPYSSLNPNTFIFVIGENTC